MRQDRSDFKACRESRVQRAIPVHAARRGPKVRKGIRDSRVRRVRKERQDLSDLKALLVRREQRVR